MWKTEGRNIIKWWYVNAKDDPRTAVSIRGWSEEIQQRYELSPCGDAWELLAVVKHELDDGWGFRLVASGTVLECMAAAEKDADGRYDAMREDEWEHHER